MEIRKHRSIQVETLIARAEECRVLARMATELEVRSSYIQLAESYDLLAKKEEQLAGKVRE